MFPSPSHPVQIVAAFVVCLVWFTKLYAQQEESFAAAALTPFWRASQIEEPVLFIQETPDQKPAAKLLFTPSIIVKLTSATREIEFVRGRDYEVDLATGTLRLPIGSRVPFLTPEQIYPLMTSATPKFRRMNGDTERGVFFDNGSRYHELQCVVTYEFKPGQWKGWVGDSAADSLPRTIGKLTRHKPVRLFLCGDSISAGFNATKFTKAKPGCPAYGELVALGLKERYDSEIDFKNFAENGWTSTAGLEEAQKKRIGQERPDLVIIAFGMNDVFEKDANKYQSNVKELMATIRTDSPESEFILVAPMLGNKEWGMPMEQFALYRDSLKELCRRGVVLADLTSVWGSFLEKKSFYDLTGNGLNHPNDFGHAVYAQAILSLLAPEECNAR